MPEDLFLELLMKQSLAHLRELRAAADDKIRKGELERAYIDEALKAKGVGKSPHPVQAISPRSTAARRGSAKPGSTREPMIQIAEGSPEHAWLPSEMRDLLQDRFGIDVATGTVRAAMKRLLGEGVFARPYDGGHGFKLVSTNGSGQEPLVEATSSEAGGYERQSAPAPTDGLE
jgi:hypothetical protein